MPNRSDAPVPVAFPTRNAVRKLKLELSARIGEELTYDDVVLLLLDDHDAIDRIEDMILSVIESLVDDAGGCMTSLPAVDKATMPIKDVISLLNDLKAVIEGDGEDVRD